MLAPVFAGFFVATLVIALGWRPWSGRVAGEATEQDGPVGGPWAVAIGAAVLTLSAYTINQQGKLPPWPPESWSALYWTGIPLLPLAVLGGRRLTLGGLVYFGLAAVSFWIAFGPYRANQWAEDSPLWIWLPCLSLAATLIYLGLERRAQRAGRGPEAPFQLLLILGAGCKLMFDAGSSGASLTLAGFCSLAGGLMVLGFWRKDLPVLRGVAAHLAWVPVAMVFQARFYASLEDLPAVLMLSALAAVGIPGGGKLAAALRTVLIGILLGLALYLGWPAPNPYA
ncbi:MAG: hypothetical protein ACI8QC_000652 [Planctomycetota bacterium]|jgi:hypothetical protein